VKIRLIVFSSPAQAPPLCITDEQMEDCIKIIASVLGDIRSLPKHEIVEEDLQLDLNVTGATGGL
jgi:hypothetical protein